MKWQDVKDFLKDLNERPKFALSAVVVLLLSVFLITLASGLGGRISKLEWPFWSSVEEQQPDCEELFQTNSEKWMEEC